MRGFWGENGGRILRGSGKYITTIFIFPSEVSLIAYNLRIVFFLHFNNLYYLILLNANYFLLDQVPG